MNLFNLTYYFLSGSESYSYIEKILNIETPSIVNLKYEGLNPLTK